MNNNVTFWDYLLIAGAICGLTYTFFMSWFRPKRFLERSVKMVKDYWPSADFFRSYYGSASWLWTMRVASTVFVLAFLFVAYNFLLSLLSTTP